MCKNLFIAVIFIGVTLTGPAFAHARLVNSSPASDAEVQTAPKTLKLTFSEEVKLAVLSLTVAGTTIPVTWDKTAPSAKTVVVPLSASGPGRYEVKWTAISSDDGHVTRGSFAFTLVGAAPGH